MTRRRCTRRHRHRQTRHIRSTPPLQATHLRATVRREASRVISLCVFSARRHADRAVVLRDILGPFSPLPSRSIPTPSPPCVAHPSPIFSPPFLTTPSPLLASFLPLTLYHRPRHWPHSHSHSHTTLPLPKSMPCKPSLGARLPTRLRVPVAAHRRRSPPSELSVPACPRHRGEYSEV